MYMYRGIQNLIKKNLLRMDDLLAKLTESSNLTPVCVTFKNRPVIRLSRRTSQEDSNLPLMLVYI